MHQIPSFVITGGPCAGKSTGLSRLRDHLANLGYTVLICPEAATSLLGSGIIPGKTVSNELFQELIFKKILSNEAICMKAAKSLRGAKPIIICDRGIMDGLAYTNPEHFQELCAKFRGDITMFRDKRYRAVMHLRTAALGAEDFYSLENNETRTETPKEARALDERTLHAWVGQPHLRVIPNKLGETFDTKIDHLIEEICHVLGEPVPLEIERKFLVEIPDWNALPHSFPHFERIAIVQHYLAKDKDGVKRRIRARGQNGSWFYTETTKRKITDITRIETERIISEREYKHLSATALDPTRMTIRKYRHCFVWKHQYFELDVFEKPALTHALLEIELTHETQKVCLPPFLSILREVSDDPLWGNSTIAKRITP
jgi:CYTH domain-containing protein/predicted ATPase